jgi:multiple sugar transport system permease protein
MSTMNTERNPVKTSGTVDFTYLRNYTRNRAGDWLTLAFLTAIAVLTVAPLLWVVSTSLRTPAESFTLPPKWIPVDMDFTNYSRVFDEIPFWRQIGNSFVITLATVAGQLVTATLAGYAFARLKFPGRDILFWVVLATMMVPFQAIIIPVFILVARVFGLAFVDHGVWDVLAAPVFQAGSRGF